MTVWIFAVCAFYIVFQLVCCYVFKRMPLKLLPLYLLFLSWLYCLVEFFGMGFDKGPWSGLWALVLAIFSGTSSAAVALAWIFYGSFKLITGMKSNNKNKI